MSSSLELSTDAHQGTIWVATINRPERRNALDNATIDALVTALREAAGNEQVRAVVITGAGTTAFCAGSDLKAARDMTAVERVDHTARAQTLMRLIESHPCLIVAAIEGYALGGGFELALACDLRVAGSGAQFGLPEVAKGMIPTWGGTFRLTQALGLARAQSILLGGARMNADEALAAGLVLAVAREGEAAMQSIARLADLTAESTRDNHARAKALLRAGIHADSATASTLELMAETLIAQGEAYGNPTA